VIGRSLNSLLIGATAPCLIFSFVLAESQNDIVEAKIGNARFSVPRAFVTHWLPNARAGANLAIEFGYPGGEPFGLRRFGGDPVKWSSFVKAAREKGTDRIFLEISAAKPKPDFDPQRASQFMEATCRLMWGNPEKFQQLNVEFVRCTGRGKAI